MIILVSRFAPPNHSGAGKRVYSFFQYLKERGYEVRLITNTQKTEKNLVVIKNNPIAEYSGNISPIVIFFYTFAQLVYRYISGDFKVSDKIRTVWLVSASPLTAAAGLFFNLMGYRIITQNVLMHSDDPARRPSGKLNLTHKLRMLQYYLSDMVTSNSPGLYELSRAEHRDCVMIPNPVEIPGTKTRRIRNSRRNILIVGSLSLRKGTDIVLKTIDIIHKSLQETNFTFIGPNKDVDRYLMEIYEACENINRKNVHFLGYQSDPRPWYKNADIFFLPSRREGFPSVFIEAMAYGLPVVVKKLDGITDFIFDNSYPGVIDSEDAEQYAKAITQLLVDDAYYLSLVTKLKKNVLRFEKEKIYGEYLNIITRQ
jgi:glycosyltransferase involved in cell wall biosynthesis